MVFLTDSYFSSQGTVSENVFTVGAQTSAPYPTPTSSPSDDEKKIDICHRDNGGDPYHLISISISALEAHLKHGDIYPVPETGCPIL